MYFPDLSPYTYIRPEPNTLNIGWLDKRFPYPVGSVPATCLQRLAVFRRYVVNNCCCGPHTCEYCEDKYGIGEIRVFGLDGTMYAAPAMIDHYIIAHHYRPPQVFIDAVLFGPLPDSAAYRALAQACPWASQLKVP